MPKEKEWKPDVQVDGYGQHVSRKAACGAATKDRGGTVSNNQKAGFGGKKEDKKHAVSKGGDGGVRSERRPDDFPSDAKIKDVDLHKFTKEEAKAKVEKCLGSLRDSDVAQAFCFDCGAGMHTQVNKYGRDVKETGDWKAKEVTLHPEIVKLVKAAQSKDIGYFIPKEDKKWKVEIYRKHGSIGSAKSSNKKAVNKDDDPYGGLLPSEDEASASD